VYWKKDDIDPPQWQRTELQAALPDLDLEHDSQLPEDVLAYCRFYGLDLWLEFPDIHYHFGAIDCGPHRVAVHYYRQPESAKGTIFVLHGYFDHVGLYSQLIERCLDAGFDVVSYDEPGHGLSSGVRAAIGSFEEYQAVLKAVLETTAPLTRGPLSAVGQSTGGAILIDYLLSNGHTPETSPFKNVVLLAPLVRPVGWVGARIMHSLLRPFMTRWRRLFAENSGNPQFLEFLREKDPLQARSVHSDWVGALRQWIPRIESARPIKFPVTVVQGEKDLTVDWEHNLRIIRNKFSEVTERRIPAARHHLVNEAPDLQSQVFDYVIDACTPRRA